MAGLPQPMSRRGAAVLASDEDRDRAARSLRRHYATGRLDAEDLERRLAYAVSARTRAELAALFRDLPSDRGRRLARINRRLLQVHTGGLPVGKRNPIRHLGVRGPGGVLAGPGARAPARGARLP